MLMKITVLGTGNIGGTLGRKWAGAGHEVYFGSRDPAADKVRSLLDSIQGQAEAGSYAKALASGEVVLVAIPHRTVGEFAAEHSAALDKKILIDATNDFGAEVINNLAALQSNAPGAQIYRAFNSLGWEVFAEPQFDEIQADHFYCGPPGDAQDAVETLIVDAGLWPIYVGDLGVVSLVDNLGSIWVQLAVRRGLGRHTAFKFLT